MSVPVQLINVETFLYLQRTSWWWQLLVVSLVNSRTLLMVSSWQEESSSHLYWHSLTPPPPTPASCEHRHFIANIAIDRRNLPFPCTIYLMTLSFTVNTFLTLFFQAKLSFLHCNKWLGKVSLCLHLRIHSLFSLTLARRQSQQATWFAFKLLHFIDLQTDFR